MIRTALTALSASVLTLPAAAHHEPGFVPGHPALIFALLAVPVMFGVAFMVRQKLPARIRRRSDK